MRICLICVEIFAWGKFGGFGRATRLIGRELVKRGLEVFAVVPRREGQKSVEMLDGITVLSFPSRSPWTATQLLKKCNADIYHSCEPSFSTHLAMKAIPHKKHIISMRDPRDFADWKMEFDLPTLGKLQVLSNFLYEDNFLVRQAVRKADAVYCVANCLSEKVKNKYRLSEPPRFLPTPVSIPGRGQKSAKPTVCYLARWDRRKRPELFLRLAERFPDVHFIAMGNSRDVKWDRYLREKYSDLPNLDMPGFVDQFHSDTHSKILEKSWILVNTATREGLPNSFLEAAAHGCAILSAVNPDGFASNFGHHVTDDHFDQGLETLLVNHTWKNKGLSGQAYVQKTFETSRAIDQHVNQYEQVMSDFKERQPSPSLILQTEGQQP